jgi:hypothetical protein
MSRPPNCGRFKLLSASKMDPRHKAVPEADIPRVRQVILDDLRNAERTLARVVAAGPNPERGSHLHAIRTAIAKLETIVAQRPES